MIRNLLKAVGKIKDARLMQSSIDPSCEFYVVYIEKNDRGEFDYR